jgi:hypothetical protein
VRADDRGAGPVGFAEFADDDDFALGPTGGRVQIGPDDGEVDAALQDALRAVFADDLDPTTECAWSSA